MADYFQNGSITTLQDLVHRPLEAIEKELKEFSLKKNSVLLLPALYSEFKTPAMHTIINQLKKQYPSIFLGFLVTGYKPILL